MEKRYDVSYLVSNGKGCGYMEHKTFLDKTLDEVRDWCEKVCEEHKGCEIKFVVFEGWGMNQKQIRSWYMC